MYKRLLALALALTPALRAADETVGVTTPLATLEAGGPTAAVTALAFSPDAATLYSAGHDKVVRVWRRDPATGAFALDPAATLRVPIGPGRDGVLNVMAVSPDGAWVAASGLSVFPKASGFGTDGWINPPGELQPAMKRDRYAIWLFNSATRAVVTLRGHEETVQALAFVPGSAKPRLVSIGRGDSDRAGSVTGRVCVWDIGRNDGPVHQWNEPAIAVSPESPPPGLALEALRNGGTRVAAAWGDGILRVRELGPIGERGLIESADEPRGNRNEPARFTTSIVAAPGALLTGGYVNNAGYLRVWDSEPGQPPRQRAMMPLTQFDPANMTAARALLLVSSAPGRGLDHAALVLRTGAGANQPDSYRIALLDLKTRTFANVTFPIGRSAVAPVVAASPDGRHVAIVGDNRREIRVIPVGDLFAARAADGAVLRGEFGGAAEIAFATQGRADRLGLVFRDRDGDRVLDVANRTVTRGPGWTTVSPADAGWRVEWVAAAPRDFRWKGPRTSGTTRLGLNEKQIVTASAIVPPPRPDAEPVLAVAVWDTHYNESILGLYNVADGEELRRLNSHVAPVRSLAATPDGRLLASAGDDPTVCVWAVNGVAALANRNAVLPGVILKRDGRGVVVDSVEPGSSAVKTLATGDVIQSFAVEGRDAKPRTAANRSDFFNAIIGERPGTTIRLDIRRGDASLPVRVKLGRIADERKPLATVFVTRGPAPEWIAWSPNGFFDAGNRDTERFLGWHFNPAKVGEAVRFAGAAVYRRNMHKAGLLQPLFAQGNLTKALQILEPPVVVARPTLQVEMDGADLLSVDEAAPVLVRDPRVDLKLRVWGPAPEKNELDALTWRLDNGDVKRVALPATTGEPVSLPVDLQRRGIHRVTLAARTRETNPQTATKDVVLRYQPPPPRIVADGPADRRVTVTSDKFQWKATIERGRADQPVSVWWRKGNGTPQKGGVRVDQTVPLDEGENVLEMWAVNDGVNDDAKEFETARHSVVVVYQKVDAPTIAVSDVHPIGADGRDEPEVFGPSYKVGRRTVRVKGRISATQALTAAKFGDSTVKNLKPDSKEVAFNETVTLKQPGANTIELRAKTADSPEAIARLTFDYVPPLPTLTLTDPAPDRELVEGRDERNCDVSGTLSPPEGMTLATLPAYEVSLRVMHNDAPVLQDGQPEMVFPAERLADGKLSARLRIEPGDNRVEVSVRSQWRDPATVERHVRFAQPPKITRVAAAAPGAKPFSDVTADVSSGAKLTRVECNGREYPVEQVVSGGNGKWTVKIAELALTPGRNSISLSVNNAEGPCLAPGEAEVTFTPPKPPDPPRVELVNHPQGPTSDARFTARYVVRSTGGKVRRVELRRDAQVLAQAADPSQQESGADTYLANGELGPVTLRDGANRLTLVAVNDGGASEAAFDVSYMAVPEWLELDQPAATVPNAEFALTGRVRWTGVGREKELEQKVRSLRLYVNGGYQQQKPELRLAGANRIDFRIPAVLNQPTSNLLEVECPGLHPDAGSRQRLTVDCAHPRLEPRTLHLLFVAIHAHQSGRSLATRALDALYASQGPQGPRSTVFQHVRIHPVTAEEGVPTLSGYVRQEHVTKAIESIRRYSKPNDVALIYWLGTEEADAQGNLYLHTSQTRAGVPLPQTSIAVSSLLEFPNISNVPGACVILLDTTSVGGQPVALPRPSNRVALLRYAWSRQAKTVPGLMLALEEASRTRNVTSLLDLATQAEQPRPGDPKVENNLRELPALRTLVISRKP